MRTLCFIARCGLLMQLVAWGGAGCNRRPAASGLDKQSAAHESPPTAAAETPPVANQSTADDRTADAEHQASLALSEENDSDIADAEAIDESEQWQEGNWTTRRLIALGDSGPTVIDLSLSIGRQHLQEACDAAVANVSDAIFAELAEPVTWNALVEHPLIRSGWLGNLVPEDEQRDQIVRMYDTEMDDMVSATELAAFLSRGLARNDPLQISDAGVERDANMSQSPWGAADSNRDFALDTAELGKLASAIHQFDYNGDNIIALQELSDMSAPAAAETSMAKTMLPTKTLMPIDEIALQDSAEAERARRKFSKELITHYTFLPELPREQWPSWSDDAWSQLDTDDSQSLNRAEVEQLTTMTPDAVLYVRFPSLDEESLAVGFQMRSQSSRRLAAWHASESGAQLSTAATTISVQLRDAFSTVGRSQLRQQLAQALKTPQLKTFLQTRLQLQEDAFDLLDPNQDEQLSDEEFAAAWQWLSIRQGTRLLARWMVAATPWFCLADSDGDQRLSELEIATLAERIATLDRNTDGMVTPNELPLIIKLEISRADGRLVNQQLGMPQPSSEFSDGDWFSAMDTNRDGTLSYREFLGDRDDFERLDANKDSFVSPSEVY